MISDLIYKTGTDSQTLKTNLWLPKRKGRWRDWSLGLKYAHHYFHFHALEKEMATHSSVLAWRIPGTGEPGGLPSLGSHRVGHD